MARNIPNVNQKVNKADGGECCCDNEYIHEILNTNLSTGIEKVQLFGKHEIWLINRCFRLDMNLERKFKYLTGNAFELEFNGSVNYGIGWIANLDVRLKYFYS